MTRPVWLRIPFDLITIALFMAMTTAVVGSLLRVSSSDRYTVLLPLGLAGVICGYILARYQVSDYLAHSIALWIGLVAAMFAATTIQTSASEIVDTRFGVYNRLLQDLVRSIFSREGSTIERNEMLVALGMVAWLVAYTSTWIYVRRGWFWLAIVGPAVVMLVALHLDEDEGVWQVGLFLISAACLAARNARGGWQASWAQRRVPVARGLVRRLTLLALPVATVAVLIATLTAPVVHDFATNNAGQTLKNAWDSTVSSLAQISPIQGQSKHAYNSFSDEIEIGQELTLGDEIVVTASLASPRYLRVRTYNVYTGHGWTTDIATTFNADGSNQGPVTKVTYQPEQTVSVSFADQVLEEGTVTVVMPMDGAVPVIDQFSSVDQQVFALMSWQQIDLPYPVNSINLDSVPIDVQELVKSVQGQKFEVDDKTGDVHLTDPAAQKKFELEQEAVAAYPIMATLSVDDDGALLLTLTGRLPVYDDIEKVLTKADDGNPGTYSVSGSTSAATVADLQQAGTEYPSWVTERYLQLPDSVTNDTKQKAEEVTANLSNPYDRATAIETFLRTNFDYEPNSPKPDGDAVDFFLFERKAGRCEQFAAAMVVMLRAEGIPARLVSGYRDSPEIDPNGEYVYRALQAHQWVEVYIPTYGWIEFEPTANQPLFDRDNVGAETVEADTTPVPDEGTPEPIATPDITPEPTSAASPVPPALDLPESSGGGSAGWLIALAIGLAAIAGTIALGAFNWSWKTRGLSETGSLLYRLQRVGGWFGIHPTPSTTPAEYATRFGERFPPVASSAKSITDAYYHETFGPQDRRPDLIARAETGWSRIRTTVLRSPFHRRSLRKGKKHS